MMINRFAQTIAREEIAELPPIGFGGEIIVVEGEQQLAEACGYLRKQRLIGFDTETRPSFKAGVIHRTALLQLSTHERCYLIRLCKLSLDKSITKILENKDIIKVGADVLHDLQGLQKLRRFRHDGFIDIQSIAPEWGIGEKSLRKLAAIVLGSKVSKAQRLTNWEAAELTAAQKMYAATDAWVCIEIFNRLNATEKK